MHYNDFKDKLNELADQIIDLAYAAEVAADVSMQDASCARENVREAVVNLVDAVLNDFGTLLDD